LKRTSKKKLDALHDPAKFASAEKFVVDNTGPITEGGLQEALLSGERLCKIFNAWKPGTIKGVNTGSKFAAMHRENISNYLKACAQMSFNKAHLFDTADLYDGKNMPLVVENLMEIQRRFTKGGASSGSAAGGKVCGDCGAAVTGSACGECGAATA